MLRNSPIALRCLKAALNADCDGQSGLQELAGNATMLFYMTEEGQEGRNAFNENAHQTSANSDVILNLNIKSAVQNQCVFNCTFENILKSLLLFGKYFYGLRKTI